MLGETKIKACGVNELIDVRFLLAVLVAAASGALFAAPSILDRAADAGKGVIILQAGSDWCVSGEDVRKVFEGDGFRRSVGSKYLFAVYDDRDEPDAKTTAANETLKPAVIRSKRFPAITCITPPPARFFAQFENLPRTITDEKLADMVNKAVKRSGEAEMLFRKGKSLRDTSPAKAANAYGSAFDILGSQTGRFNVTQLLEGPLAYKAEWEALRALDKDDRYGWARHFTMDFGIEIVTEANRFREKGDFEGGKAYIASLRRMPQTHLSVNQRQSIDMAEYALWRKDPAHEKSNLALLERVFSLGRGTLWGQSAMGYLILSGKDIKRKEIKRVELIKRPAKSTGKIRPFPLDALKRRLVSVAPDAELADEQKTDIALYAVLRRIGENAWRALQARPGANIFLKAFFKDRRWMEDFAWSGPCDGERAILNLESLFFQDFGRWIKGDNAGRRFATAVALEYLDRDEAWLADFMDAYRSTAKAGRLHRRALAQPVWQWRFAVHQGQPTASVDDAPRQQRFLSWYVNMPLRDYGGACWMIPYRTFNCFGDSVQGPHYYESWEAAGEWPKRRYSPIVGGVCGELSKFGSACSNAHGLPSCTAGQPAHCAYTRRLLGGKWEIDNSVDRPTLMHVKFWDNPVWSYVQAYEGTFEGEREKRLDADRMIELAHLSEERGMQGETVEAFFRRACRVWPQHYNAWREYGEWMKQPHAPLEATREWVRACAAGLRTGRHPLWDFLTPYFARVADEKGVQALADELVEMAPLLRQDASMLQEESDFKEVLKQWTARLSGNAQRMAPVLKAVLLAQYGTRDYFAQTLGWGWDAMMSAKGGTEAFLKTLEDVVAAKSTDGAKAKLDFAPLILGASRAGNREAFRQLAQLQDRLEPVPESSLLYPTSDFGGELLSSDGMLRTSSTSSWDVPARYARCLDRSPCERNAFHTGKEKSPWAVVILAGAADICGVIAENRGGGSNRARQVPIEVQLSEDGQTWSTVFRADDVRDTYRVDISASPRRATQVRVRRAPDSQENFFHLGKILVYGRKLY